MTEQVSTPATEPSEIVPMGTRPATSRGASIAAIVGHVLVEIIILAGVWVCEYRGRCSVWVALGTSAVIGGWVPASLVAQLVRTWASGGGQLPRVPPPVTMVMAAGAVPIARQAVRSLASLFTVPLLFAVGMLAVGMLGCPVVREGTLLVTPGVPQPSGCVEGTERCLEGRPCVCSSSGRWWSAMTSPCPHGCVVDDAGPRCSAAPPMDASLVLPVTGGDL